MFKVDSCTISISCMSLPLLLFPSLHFDGIALWGGMAWELGVREGSRYQTEVEFASRVNFSIFTHFLCFFSLKLLKLGEIDGVKFLAWKSGSVKFWTNSLSERELLFHEIVNLRKHSLAEHWTPFWFWKWVWTMNNEKPPFHRFW